MKKLVVFLLALVVIAGCIVSVFVTSLPKDKTPMETYALTDEAIERQIPELRVLAGWELPE